MLETTTEQGDLRQHFWTQQQQRWQGNTTSQTANESNGKTSETSDNNNGNDWFRSYLSDLQQYVFFYKWLWLWSHLNKLRCFSRICSRSLPFLLYINDLNQAIKFCKVHHFADDTNLLYLGKSIKKLNKFVNIDLKNLVNWLNANKISLNVKITEMVIFKSKRKKFNDIVKIN